MRPVLASLIVVGCAVPVTAQPAAYLAEVTADNVTVRSGPSDQMPETGQLFRGTKVVVEREEPGGWVAIQPPTGQVSWIKHTFLGEDARAELPVPRNVVVCTEGEADIAAGRPGLARPLDVRRTKVPDRSIVLVIGRKIEADGTVWYPIAPPDGDLRYVPKSAVRFVRGQPSPEFVVRSPDPKVTPAGGTEKMEPIAASVPNRPAATASARKPANWPNHPLWNQAEQAERDGDYGRAESLYLRLAAEMNQPGGDAELANLCYARVHAVREKGRREKTATPTGGRSDTTAEPRWVGPGTLRRVSFRIDGREAYALDGDRGQVKCYAVAGSGTLDLDRYARADVILYGSLSYSPDLRAWVVTATRLQNARDR